MFCVSKIRCALLTALQELKIFTVLVLAGEGRKAEAEATTDGADVHI